MYKTLFLLTVMLLTINPKYSYSQSDQEFIEKVKAQILSMRKLCTPSQSSSILCPVPHLHELEKTGFVVEGKNYKIDANAQLTNDRFLDNWSYVEYTLLGGNGHVGFLNQPLVKRIISDWVPAEHIFEATDFNDLYKASMNGVISGVSPGVSVNIVH